MNKPVAWSYSSLTAFETCPKRYYLTKITKQVTEPQTEATVWGNSVHKALEHRVADNRPLPSTMVEFEPMALSVLAKAKDGGRVEAEQKLCLDQNFHPVSWFDKRAWVRGIIDVSVTKGDKMFVGDWKTGKPKPESAQLKLFAAMAMQTRPYINTVHTAFIWLKHKEVTVEKYERDQLPELWQEFMPRVQRLEHAVANTKFPARPSGLCRAWCPVGKALCEHCGV